MSRRRQWPGVVEQAEIIENTDPRRFDDQFVIQAPQHDKTVPTKLLGFLLEVLTTNHAIANQKPTRPPAVRYFRTPAWSAGPATKSLCRFDFRRELFIESKGYIKRVTAQ